MSVNVASTKSWKLAIVVMAIAMLMALLPGVAAAQEGFDVYVRHGIDGTALGLSQELPVIANVYLNGELLAAIPLEYQDEFRATLPDGEYLITIYSVELETEIESMQVGPVEIGEEVNKVNLYAKLVKGEPDVVVRVR